MRLNFALHLFLVLLFLSITSFAQREHPNHFFWRINESNKLLPPQNANSILKERLGLGHQVGFMLSITEDDRLGYTHNKYQFTYNNIPVENGVFRVHTKGGIIQIIQGEYYDVQDINTIPSISETIARNQAIDNVSAHKYFQTGNDEMTRGSLVIYDNQLAWKFEILTTKPLGRFLVYIDAHEGKLLDKISLLCTTHAIGQADTRFTGSVAINTDNTSNGYVLKDNIRNIHTYDLNGSTDFNQAVELIDSDNQWKAEEYHANRNDAALDAHWGLGLTYDYFLAVHGRNSFDGNGAEIKAYTSYDVDLFNAFWFGSLMVRLLEIH